MNRKKLKNTYFLLRHGHSLANEKGLIISNPLSGTTEYGLTEQGEKQVRAAAEYFSENDNPIIYSSDFLRTVETAEIVKEILSTGEIHYTEKLRERFFGFYDNLNDTHYKEIWEKDKNNENNIFNHVESPRNVADRAASLIDEIELQYNQRKILLISHGDSLQILQTVFEDISPADHRSLRHLQTAEVRKISLLG